jgi:polysaccharide biosynthesis protein PslH
LAPATVALGSRNRNRHYLQGHFPSVTGYVVRPKLLFLSHNLPYPPHSGGQNRTYHVARQLEKAFDVTLLPFSRKNHHRNIAELAAARDRLSHELTRVGEPRPIRSERSGIRNLRDHLLSVATGRPYTSFQYRDGVYLEQLESYLSQEQPDLIHLDAIDLAGYIPYLPQVPITCTHHDIESELLHRKAEHVRPRALRFYVRHQSALVRRLEEYACPRFALNLTMSHLDANRLRQIAPDATTAVIPNGVDTRALRPEVAKAVGGRVVFIGPTYILANRDAVDLLLTDIWNRIRAGFPDATLRLLGRNPPRDQARYDQVDGIVGAGYVPDVRPHLAEASCSVVPVRVGGGTRIKILESWAMGLPVVSTSLGCEGLEAVDGRNILIRDDPESFARAVTEVLSDPSLRRRLRENGRRTAEDLYSWDSIGERLRSAYSELMRSAENSRLQKAG